MAYFSEGARLPRGRGNFYYGAMYVVYPERSLGDPKISVWLSVDPLAHEFPGWSSYNFTMNNPLNLVDPDGRKTIVNSKGVIIYHDNSSDDKNIYLNSPSGFVVGSEKDGLSTCYNTGEVLFAVDKDINTIFELMVEFESKSQEFYVKINDIKTKADRFLSLAERMKEGYIPSEEEIEFLQGYIEETARLKAEVDVLRVEISQIEELFDEYESEQGRRSVLRSVINLITGGAGAIEDPNNGEAILPEKIKDFLELPAGAKQELPRSLEYEYD